MVFGVYYCFLSFFGLGLAPYSYFEMHIHLLEKRLKELLMLISFICPLLLFFVFYIYI